MCHHGTCTERLPGPVDRHALPSAVSVTAVEEHATKVKAEDDETARVKAQEDERLNRRAHERVTYKVARGKHTYKQTTIDIRGNPYSATCFGSYPLMLRIRELELVYVCR